ncbi:MAG: hypothetical protein LH606_12000 [Cytophagaceae bacterium]|nr:hypothetical protein [Cytophagaceae bacterium]
MKNTLLLITLLGPVRAVAQETLQHQAERLQAALQKSTQRDADRLTLWNRLADGFKNINPTEGIKAADQAVELARELRQPLALAEAHQNKGLNLLRQGKYDEAMHQFILSRKMNQQQNHKKGVAKNNCFLAETYRNKGQLKETIRLLNQSIGFYQKEKDKSGLALALYYRGVCYRNQAQYDSALVIFNDSP